MAGRRRRDLAAAAVGCRGRALAGGLARADRSHRGARSARRSSAVTASGWAQRWGWSPCCRWSRRSSRCRWRPGWSRRDGDARPRSAMAAVSAAGRVGYLLVPGNDPRLGGGRRRTGAGSRLRSRLPRTVPRRRRRRGVHPARGALGVPAERRGPLLGGPWPAGSSLPGLGAPGPSRIDSWTWRQVVAVALLLLLVNVPVLLSSPRQGSPRVFTPTWLVLAAVVALG